MDDLIAVATRWERRAREMLRGPPQLQAPAEAILGVVSDLLAVARRRRDFH